MCWFTVYKGGCGEDSSEGAPGGGDGEVSPMGNSSNQSAEFHADRVLELKRLFSNSILVSLGIS